MNGRDPNGRDLNARDPNGVDPNGPGLATLERDVLALYLADYAAAWDGMLADLSVAPPRSVPRAAQDLYILAAPESPMRALLVSVARQLALAAASAPETAAGAAPGPADDTAARLRRLLAAQGGGTGTDPAQAPGHEIDDRYKALRDVAGTGPGAPIERILRLIGDVQQPMAKLAAAPPGSAAPAVSGPDPALALQAEAARQPPPLGRWLAAIAGAASVLRAGGTRQLQAVAAWNGPGGPAASCPAIATGRYPFAPNAAADVPLDEFGRLFAPGGILDGFLNTQLKPFVDSASRPWKPRDADGAAAPVTAADLVQFQRAAAIRDAFFAGGATPRLRFDLTPAALDPGTLSATLDLDGTTVTATHGPPRATQIAWPGPGGTQSVRLSFDPPPSGGSAALSAAGPWAMFRLFSQGRLAPAGPPGRIRLSFQLGERQAAFDIQADAAANPFAPGLIQDFRCPAVQP